MFHIFKFVSIVSIVSNYREETVPRDDKAGRSLLYDGGGRKKRKGEKERGKGEKERKFCPAFVTYFFLK